MLNWTDEALMGAYQNGEIEAFFEIYRRFAPRVLGYLLKRINDRAVAEDVMQEAFQKLHASRHSFDVRLPLAPWIFTIAHNAWMDVARKAERDRQGLAGYELLHEVAAGRATAEIEYQTLLNELPERYRQVIDWRYREELSFEDIAQRLHTSPANIRQIVSRALKLIKRKKGGSRHEPE